MLSRSPLKWAGSVKAHIHHAWMKLHLGGGAPVCPVCNVRNPLLKIQVCVRAPIFLSGDFGTKIHTMEHMGHASVHSHTLQLHLLTTPWSDDEQWVHVSFSMQHLQCTPVTVMEFCHLWLLPNIWSSWWMIILPKNCHLPCSLHKTRPKAFPRRKMTWVGCRGVLSVPALQQNDAAAFSGWGDLLPR